MCSISCLDLIRPHSPQRHPCHSIRRFVQCDCTRFFSERLQATWPRYVRSRSSVSPPATYVILSSLTPAVFLPLSFLSYTSLVGIISTVFLVVVIFVDGFSKFDAPGSLWSPAETSFGISNLHGLGLAFGLFMAGVCRSISFSPLDRGPEICSL